MSSRDFFRINISFVKEIVLTVIAIVMTCISTSFLGYQLWTVGVNFFQQSDHIGLIQHLLQSFFFFFFVYGNFVYLLSRYGYFCRLRQHCPTSEEELESIYAIEAPTLTVLVPSYKEEMSVIRRSLLSSALQDYPNCCVVLLIDDPPHPTNEKELAALIKARQLPQEIEQLLRKPREVFQQTFDDFLEREKTGVIDNRLECKKLSQLYTQAATWFEKQAAEYVVSDHIDQTFISLTFVVRAKKLRERAHQLFESQLDGEKVRNKYRHLATLFHARIIAFERKRYVNLSHAPNKAMNLNSYLGLMGKSFVERSTKEGFFLQESLPDEAEFHVLDSHYVIMLDADSVLTHDYAVRLIHEMEKLGNERLALIQTHYSAFPNAPSITEKIAGVITDIQYILQQGFTYFDATFWVGNNGLIRKEALDAIAEHDEERGYSITRFIPDRTLIEDAEYSVDLIEKGWKLFNYPERVSYTATPPDFGSLLIQRCRWANGGLLILPKLFRYLFSKPWSLRKVAEVFFRFHYLSSTAVCFPGLLLFMTVLPPPNEKLMPWLLMAILPYIWVYVRDLKLTGYLCKDLFYVWAMNLILIPINMIGVVKSLQQAVTGIRFPFHRTPKIQGRTSIPGTHVFLKCLIVGYLCWTLLTYQMSDQWIQMAVYLFSVAPFFYGLHIFIGIKEGFRDLLSLFNGSFLKFPAWLKGRVTAE